MTRSVLLWAMLVLLIGSGSARAAVIYTSDGFELKGGFSITGEQGVDSDPATLYGQGSPQWLPSVVPPSDQGYGVPADIETSLTDAGSQAVSLTRVAGSVNTEWEPSLSSYTPGGAQPIISLDWDMNVASGGTNAMFGVDFADSSSRIAFLLVDSSGNIFDDHNGTFFKTTASPVAIGTWHHYTLQADFADQTCKIYVDDAAAPADTFQFNTSVTAFTTAALASFNYAAGSATGTAYYDNFVISTPEPSAAAAALLGSSLLLLRRRRAPS